MISISNTRRRAAAVMAMLCVAGSGADGVSTARAQTSSAAQSKRGVFVVARDDQLGLLPPAAERTAGLAAADKILTIVRRDDALTSPIGFRATVARAVGMTSPGHAPGMPYHYGILGSLIFFSSEDDGKGGHVVGEEGGKTRFNITVNAVEQLADMQNPPALDGGPPVLVDYRITGKFRGHSVYNGQCVYLSRGAAAAIVPVTKERYLRLRILAIRADSVRHEAQYKAGGMPTLTSAAYEKWRAGKPEREAEMRKAYDALEPIDAKAAQQVMDAFKESETQAEAAFKGASAGDSSSMMLGRGMRDGRIGIGKEIRDVEAQLATMSPAQRQQPAAMVPAGTGQERLSDVGNAEAQPLVQLNSAFFDRALSPATPQVILVCLPGLQSGYSDNSPFWTGATRAAMALIREHLDWPALEALVR